MEHLRAVKFSMGYEKNMSFLVIAKSSKVGKKVEKVGLGSFKSSYLGTLIVVIRAGMKLQQIFSCLSREK